MHVQMVLFGVCPIIQCMRYIFSTPYTSILKEEKDDAVECRVWL